MERGLAWRLSNLEWGSSFVAHTRKTPASSGLGLLEGDDAAPAEMVVVGRLLPAVLADLPNEKEIGDPLVRAVGRQEV